MFSIFKHENPEKKSFATIGHSGLLVLLMPFLELKADPLHYLPFSIKDHFSLSVLLMM